MLPATCCAGSKEQVCGSQACRARGIEGRAGTGLRKPSKQSEVLGRYCGQLPKLVPSSKSPNRRLRRPLASTNRRLLSTSNNLLCRESSCPTQFVRHPPRRGRRVRPWRLPLKLGAAARPLRPARSTARRAWRRRAYGHQQLCPFVSRRVEISHFGDTQLSHGPVVCSARWEDWPPLGPRPVALNGAMHRSETIDLLRCSYAHPRNVGMQSPMCETRIHVQEHWLMGLHC